jgi:protein-disulfide isomerase
MTNTQYFLRTGVVLLAFALSSVSVATEQRPLFQFGGLEFSEGDLGAESRQQIFAAYARYRSEIDSVVTNAAVRLYIEEQAEKTGQSPDAIRAKLLPAEPIPEADLQGFYSQNQQRIRMPFEQVRGQIVEYLSGERDKARKAALVQSLTEAGQLKSLLPRAQAPSVQIAHAGFPSKGAANAPVTVVEFADFQCPHCKAAHPAVASLLDKFPGKVRVVFMHLPVNRSGISRKVAHGAVCAQSQNKFWDYHDLAFARQGALSDASPVELARAVGLDVAAFEACYASDVPVDQIIRSEAEAARLGVSSTPTLYVNGQRVRVTHDTTADLHGAVEAALK